MSASITENVWFLNKYYSLKGNWLFIKKKANLVMMENLFCIILIANFVRLDTMILML